MRLRVIYIVTQAVVGMLMNERTTQFWYLADKILEDYNIMFVAAHILRGLRVHVVRPRADVPNVPHCDRGSASLEGRDHLVLHTDLLVTTSV